MAKSTPIRSTTILAVQRNGQIAMGGDGQVTLGNTVVKHGATKVRKLRGGDVLVGFAGATADAFSLLERFEGKLDEHGGQVQRAAIELASGILVDGFDVIVDLHNIDGNVVLVGPFLDDTFAVTVVPGHPAHIN